MKIFSKFAIALLLALPFSANAEIVLSNYTSVDLAVSINDKCIISKIKAHSGHYVGQYALTVACLPSTDDCSAKFYTATMCTPESLVASFTFDIKKGIKTATSHNAKFQANIYQQFTAMVTELTSVYRN